MVFSTEMSPHLVGILWFCALVGCIAALVIENRIRTHRTRAFLAANFAALADASGEITSEGLLAASESAAFEPHRGEIAFAWENMHKFGHPTGLTEWVAESNQLGDFISGRPAYAVGAADLRLSA